MKEYQLPEELVINGMSFLTFDDLDVISHLEADCDTRVHVEMHHVLL
jgi:hypothetical protein